MSVRNLLLIIILVCVSLPGFSQYRSQNGNSGGIGDKVYFGGGGGFNFSNGYLNLSLSPLIGYKFTEDFSGGLQLSYQYVKDTYFDASTSNYGGGPFLRYNLSENLFLYSQYEYLNYGFINVSNNAEVSRGDNSSLFAGLGYTSPINDRLAFNVVALYNLLFEQGRSFPYSSPFQFRVGIVTGLF